jgi:hypothetical protein
MAYKFQLGAAVLSGSAKFEDGLVATDVDDTTAANVVAQIDAGEIPIAKLAESTISGIALGANLNSLSKATNGGVNFSSYNGSAAVSNLALDLSDLAAAAVNVGADSIAIYDADADVTGKETIADLATQMAGDGLAASSGVFAVNVDDSSIETNSDSLRVKAGGITNTMLSGAIANAKLVNQSVTITAGDGLKTGGAVNLGGSVTLDIDVSDFAGTGLSGDVSENLNIDAAQTGISSIYNSALIVGRGASDAHIDFGTDDQIQFDIDNAATMNLSANGINVQQGGIQVPAGADVDVAGAGAASLYASVGNNNLTLGGATSTVIVAGNLTVQGTTTSVDSTTINISSSFTFEGPADDHETILTCGTPSQDLTVNLPQFSASAGAAAYHLPVLSNAATVASSQVTAAEFALLDGGSTVGTTALASGDGFLHNDAGTMKHTSIDKIADFFAGDGLAASSGVLSVGVDDSSIETNSDALRVKALGVTNAMLAGSIADGKLNQITTAGKVALSAIELDGGTDIGAALVDADLFMVDDGAGGTMRKATMARLKTYIGGGTTAVTSFGDEDATLAVGVNFASANTSTARTLTLPASAGMSVGESIKVKVAGVASGAVTIARAGSQTIDGNNTSIVLESDNAAVELVYVAADDWRVF